MERYYHTCHYTNENDSNYRNDPRIVKEPVRNVDVSGLADDFYSNHIDWHNNHIIYISNNRIMVMDYYSGRTCELKSVGGIITSVRHARAGNMVVAGTNNGSIHLIDIGTRKHSKLSVHRSRIGTIEPRQHTLITGSRDRQIKCLDMRTRQVAFSTETHAQEVCGIRLNRTGTLLASGGNDNRVYVMDMRKIKNVFRICSHRAAVKAIDWSKRNDYMMVTGGGTADKIVRMWNISNNESVISRCLGKDNEGVPDSMDVQAMNGPTNNESISNGFVNNGSVSGAHPITHTVSGVHTMNNVQSISAQSTIFTQSSIPMYTQSSIRTVHPTSIIQPAIHPIDDTVSRMLVKAQSFNSQVCNIYWSHNDKILSTHGYSMNDARISNLSLRTTNIMCCHRNRVIHFAVNEDIGCFVTGSADNRLCFWMIGDEYEHGNVWLR